jgi:hypothetical protein
MKTLKNLLLFTIIFIVGASSALAQYDYKGSYYNGLAVVKKNNKFGFINKKGQEVVGPMYKNVGSFSEGLAAVLNFNDKWGFMNTKGDWAIPATYKEVKFFSEELAAVKNDMNLWGFIDKKGKLVIEHKYADIGDYGSKSNYYVGFKNGYLPAKKGESWGMINKKEQEIVPFKHDFVRNPREDGTIVTGIVVGGQDLEGMTDLKGSINIPNIYAVIGRLSEGLIVFKDAEKNLWGYLDVNGKQVIAPKYKMAYDFSEDCALVSTINDRIGEMFIDKSGEIILKSAYQLYGSFSNGLCMVKDKNKFGYINKKGALEIPIKYEDAKDFDDGVAIVRYRDYWGIINTKDKVIADFEYWRIFGFSEGLAAANEEKSNKWGFMNKRGKMEIKAKFDDANSFYKGKASVRLNGINFYINKDGEELSD